MSSRIYPTSFGLKVSVEIERDSDKDIAYVNVIAPLYVNKDWRMPHSYKASQFSDGQILNDSDFIRVMLNHYPLDRLN